ncbi:MAG: DUF3179 domain-containing (seleno)protein [Cyanobacteria bacterium P01_G01_bin.54]
MDKITTEQTFEPARLHQQPGLFAPFVVTTDGLPLPEASLSDSTELIVFERQGEQRALLVPEMAYHHLAQGELAGEPYIISFCGVCHSGVGMTPLVDGKVHHFEVGGLYNGVAILTDAETGTYWDHITGRAVFGPLQGTQLAVWNMEMTTVNAALAQRPQLKLLRSHQRPVLTRLMRLGQWLFGRTGFLPKLFTQTMAPEDPRLPRMTLGLGVVVERSARFYPLSALQQGVQDELENRPLRVTLNGADGVPQATWQEGTRPLQYFLRWYGFALTFPHCTIYPSAHETQLD